MTDRTLVERYIEIWNESDPDARRTSIAGFWAEDGAYTDPLADVRGHEAISELVGAVQAQMPGMRFRALGDPDGHHDVVRFRWELVAPNGGEAVAIGADVALTDADGRVSRVVGFLDKAPSA